MLDESRTLANLAKFFLIFLSQLYCLMYFRTAKASFWKPLFSWVKDSLDCVTMHVLYYDITITLVFAKAFSSFCSPDFKEKTLFLSTENNDLFQTKSTWLLLRDQSQPKFQSQDPFSVNQGLKTYFSLLFTV